MTSKKPAREKRANPPRSSDRTKQFRKDWERLSHSGRYDMHHLKEAMLLLIANEARYLRHILIMDSPANGRDFANVMSAGTSC
jgi:mRNA-degrading endonuclease YafQ of YafQ-DinJ toxin-antitoxin module